VKHAYRLPRKDVNFNFYLLCIQSNIYRCSYLTECLHKLLFTNILSKEHLLKSNYQKKSNQNVCFLDFAIDNYDICQRTDCKSGPLATFPICDFSFPSRQRAVDLVSRMNVSEKIFQLSSTATAIPRLGLPACLVRYVY
jgi:hypothetical protein